MMDSIGHFWSVRSEARGWQNRSVAPRIERLSFVGAQNVGSGPESSAVGGCGSGRYLKLTT